MAKLTQEVLNRLKTNTRLRFDLAEGMNRSLRTIERWLTDDLEMFCSQAGVLLIAKLTGLTEEDILEPEVEPAGTTV